MPRHFGDHFGLQHPGGGEAKEDVGTVNGVHQGAGGRVLGVAGLVGLHVLFAAHIDHAFGVTDGDVFLAHAEAAPQVKAGDGGGTGTRTHHFDFFDLLADHLEGVEHGRGGDDRGAVLVVVEDRDLHPFLELALDVEAFRGLDVFEVDAAERRLEGGDHVDEFVGVVLRQFDVKNVDPGKFLEEAAFAFHHRLAGQGADVAQAKNGRAIGNHPDQIGPRGVERGILGILDNRFAGKRHTRRIGQRQIVLVGQCLGRLHRNLARCRQQVILKRRVA